MLLLENIGERNELKTIDLSLKEAIYFQDIHLDYKENLAVSSITV